MRARVMQGFEKRGRVAVIATAFVTLLASSTPQAQAPASGSPVAGSQPTTQAETLALPAGYVIGAADKLSVRFWDDAKMSAEVVVRPDGMISLPLLNDVQAAGLTPEQLRENVLKGATAFVEGPNVQVIVTEINSRRVYITGNVANPAYYPLLGPTSVVQLISMAGGLQEYANKKNISIIRSENGRQVRYRFNYSDVEKGRNLQQNIELRPGDTVMVP